MTNDVFFPDARPGHPTVLTASLLPSLLAVSLALTPGVGPNAATAFCERQPQVQTLSLTATDRRRRLGTPGIVLTRAFSASPITSPTTPLRPADLSHTADLLALATAAFTAPELVVDAHARTLLTEAWLAGASATSSVPGMR